MTLSLKARLRRIEGRQPSVLPAVLMLPSNGTEPRGSVETKWDLFRQTGIPSGPVFIVPSECWGESVATGG